jgi:nucleoside-diphosphate-sugar epimerase
MTTTEKCYLVTGGMGCLGAWTLYHLVKRGHSAVSFDLSDDRARLNLLLNPAEQKAVTFVQGDLSQFEQVSAAVHEHQITHIIHLAALQVPFCRAQPVLGAQVNVVGTVNIFEAARSTGISHVVYASSIAVYGAAVEYSMPLIPHDAPMKPTTLYGVYKVADEGIARIYWQDHQVSSIALRPYTVYGIGRDQGLTSEPTKAILAAVKGQDFHIGFGGTMQFHFASDVAELFINAADHPVDGAYGFNMGGAPAAVETFAQALELVVPGVHITVGDTRLPFPEAFDDAALKSTGIYIPETPLKHGVQQTVQHFQTLLKSGISL